MSYNFNIKLHEGKYDVQIDTVACYGYFEHDDLGDERGGGLWFEVMPKSQSGLETKLELIDYDGVACLPRSVIDALRGAGFIVTEDFE